MITYYTDGSADPNPGPGGFAVIRDGKPYIIGGEPENSPVQTDHTTNIRMEGFAIMNAFRDALESGEKCEIITDSMFWINVLQQWAPGWERNSWSKKGGIKNLDIVQPLYKMYHPNRKLLHIKWTRGHAGTELNEMADRWASQARRRQLTDPVFVDDLDLF